MNIVRLSTTDSRFLEFVKKYKQDVCIKDHMYNWLNNNRLARISEVACLFDNESIVGISCEKIYGNKYLRIGSPLYVLRDYRLKYPHSLFTENGFFSTHLKSAKEKDLEIFFSIHSYNKRMRLHAENFYKRRITHSKNLFYIDDVQFLGIHKFHDVDQHVFSYNITNIENLLNTINYTNNF